MMAGPILADRVRAAFQDRRRRRAVVPPPAALPGGGQRLALPAPPGADRGPVCPACGYRHPPVRGLAPTWSTPIGDPFPGRPRPLRDTPDADLAALHRDRFNPWRSPYG
jgi:hypothetical protein